MSLFQIGGVEVMGLVCGPVAKAKDTKPSVVIWFRHSVLFCAGDPVAHCPLPV